MNIRLLRRIQKAILKHPNQFDMRWWFQNKLEMPDEYLPAGNCGTAACIAGWAIHLKSKNKKLSETENKYTPNHLWSDGDRIANRASRLIGVPIDDADKLFSIQSWPYRLWQSYKAAKTPLTRAKIAVKRIDHFIKTNGAE